MNSTKSPRYRLTVIFQADGEIEHYNFECMNECMDVADHYRNGVNVTVVYDRQERRFV